jgi:hypothetical protein
LYSIINDRWTLPVVAKRKVGERLGLPFDDESTIRE